MREYRMQVGKACIDFTYAKFKNEAAWELFDRHKDLEQAYHDIEKAIVNYLMLAEKKDYKNRGLLPKFPEIVKKMRPMIVGEE